MVRTVNNASLSLLLYSVNNSTPYETLGANLQSYGVD